MSLFQHRTSSNWRAPLTICASIAVLVASNAFAWADEAPPQFGTEIAQAELASTSGTGGLQFVTEQTDFLVAQIAARTASGTTNGPIQVASMPVYAEGGLPSGQLLQMQGSGGFDSSLRYLCSDKLYTDLYPSGTGWNNEAYRSCSARTQVDRVRNTESLQGGALNGLGVTTSFSGGLVEIPCGGTLQNISVVSITSGVRH